MKIISRLAFGFFLFFFLSPSSSSTSSFFGAVVLLSTSTRAPDRPLMCQTKTGPLDPRLVVASFSPTPTCVDCHFFNPPPPPHPLAGFTIQQAAGEAKRWTQHRLARDTAACVLVVRLCLLNRQPAEEDGFVLNNRETEGNYLSNNLPAFHIHIPPCLVLHNLCLYYSS